MVFLFISATGTYVDHVIEDFFKILEFAVMKWIHTLCALNSILISTNLKPYSCNQLTGNFHFVSQSALMDSWWGMRLSKASPKIQLDFSGTVADPIFDLISKIFLGSENYSSRWSIGIQANEESDPVFWVWFRSGGTIELLVITASSGCEYCLDLQHLSNCFSRAL